MSELSESKVIKVDDFINKIEIVYAVLLTWGVARVAENFSLDGDYLKPAMISVLVLVRFFFAASHNLKPAAIEAKDSPSLQNRMFIVDIPLLLIHSFVYYRMCFALSRPEHDFIGFYKCFSLLLFFNILWLAKTSLRASCEKSNGRWCKPWCWNNIVHLVVISLFIYLRQYTWLFWIALSNCLLDFYLTAPDYLGFSEKKRTTWPNFLRYYIGPAIFIFLMSKAWPYFLQIIRD